MTLSHFIRSRAHTALSAVATMLLAGMVLAQGLSPVIGEPAPSLVRDGLYVLQIGDELSIKVYRNPELDETVKVRPDGKISILLLADIHAAGLTTQEFTDVLAKRYGELIKEPQVSVILRSFANLKVYVGGEVGQPGMVPLTGNLTAVAAVFHAGGLKGSAKTDGVMLVRNNGSNQPVVQSLNLKDVLQKGKPDTLLQPFDVLFVPESKIRRIDRFVDEYIRQLIPITVTAGFTYLLSGTSTVITVP